MAAIRRLPSRLPVPDRAPKSLSIARSLGPIVLVLACLILSACGDGPDRDGLSPQTGDVGFINPNPEAVAAAFEPVTHEQVAGFCGACHGYPHPSLFPKDRWDAEVRRGYDFFHQSDLDLEAPPMGAVVAYYQQRAPEQFERLAPYPTHPGLDLDPDLRTVAGPPVDPDASTSGPLRFRRHGVVGPEPGALSAISFVDLVTLDGQPQLLACDMFHGRVMTIPARRLLDSEPGDLDASSAPWTLLCESIPHPAHATPADLDGDGRTDLIVADLGMPMPSDARLGQVVWLRGQADGSYQPTVLASELGRVTDVQAADFDGDGDVDLIVGVFGWHQVGEILYLENVAEDPGRPEFQRRTLDSRPGTIHVPVADLDDDGDLDVVALISQEHEAVVAYLNRGAGHFEARTLFEADHPAFGSSGIELVDLDGDGDLDVLMSNGDVYDAPLLKPYHGVSWLENTGDLAFEAHRLADLYGCQRARAADFDGDGDLDIVASSFLAEPFYGNDRPAHQADALILLEQVGPGRFATRSLEALRCDYPALVPGDLDGDGDLDLVVGSFRNFDFSRPGVSTRRRNERGEAVWVWDNHLRTPPPTHPNQANNTAE